MRKSIQLGLTIGLCIFGSLTLAANASLAEKGDDLTAVKQTIDLLKNQEETNKLVDYLESYVQAQEQVGKPASKSAFKIEFDLHTRLASRLFDFAERLQIRAVRGLELLRDETKNVPATVDRIFAELTRQRNIDRMIRFFLFWPLAFILTFLVWTVTRPRKKKTHQRIKASTTHPILSKLYHAGRLFVWRTLPSFMFFGTTLLLFWFMYIPKVVEIFLMSLVIAAFTFSVWIQFFRGILAVSYPRIRLWPLSNDQAQYFFIWAQRLGLFSLWFYILHAGVLFIEQIVMAQMIVAVYQIGLLFLVALMVAQWKKELVSTLRWTVRKVGQPWIKSLKVFSNSVTGKAYGLLVSYFVVMFIFAILGYPQIFWFLLVALLKSVGIFFLACLIAIGWEMVFDRLFKVNKGMKKKSPRLYEQVNRYVDYIRKGGYGIIIILASITILGVWGLDIYKVLGSNFDVIQSGIYVFILAIVAYVLCMLSGFFIDRIEDQFISHMGKDGSIDREEMQKRARTLGSIMHKAVIIIILSITGLMIFSELGINIAPLLGGVGIVGLAVGFGAQNLVKDIISGLFLIIENRIRVNDVAIINGTGGLVEEVNLRTTVLRGLDGTVHVFPNGAINTLSNMTMEFSCYAFDIGVAYKEDIDKVTQILIDIGKEMREDKEFGPSILADFEVWGLDKFADSALVVKARIKTAPLKQWWVGREFNRRIKIKFDEMNIEIPFPHHTLYWGEASQPFNLNVTSSGQKQAMDSIAKSVENSADTEPAVVPKKPKRGKLTDFSASEQDHNN